MEEIRLERLHPEFLKRAKARRLPLARLRQEIGRHESIQHLSQIPDDLRRLFVTAHDIAPEHHVRMQAVFQRHSDSGVSKTINLPPTATRKDIAAAFLLAHELMQRIDRVSLRQSRTPSIVLFPRTILLSRHPYQIGLC